MKGSPVAAEGQLLTAQLEAASSLSSKQTCLTSSHAMCSKEVEMCLVEAPPRKICGGWEDF